MAHLFRKLCLIDGYVKCFHIEKEKGNIMDEPKETTPSKKNVSNKEIKTIVIDLGADLVDTLDSIHNAILATRNELKTIKEQIAEYEKCLPHAEKNDMKQKNKTEEPKQNERESNDPYSSYIA